MGGNLILVLICISLFLMSRMFSFPYWLFLYLWRKVFKSFSFSFVFIPVFFWIGSFVVYRWRTLYILDINSLQDIWLRVSLILFTLFVIFFDEEKFGTWMKSILSTFVIVQVLSNNPLPNQRPWRLTGMFFLGALCFSFYPEVFIHFEFIFESDVR